MCCAKFYHTSATWSSELSTYVHGKYDIPNNKLWQKACLYFMHFMLPDKVFHVKSSGLGKNDNKMLLPRQISSVLLSSHHLFSCRSMQLLQLIYCQSLLCLLSNASALCWIYCCVTPPHEMSPWLFSSDVLEIMEAGFSLWLRHVNWSVCVWAVREYWLLNSAWR